MAQEPRPDSFVKRFAPGRNGHGTHAGRVKASRGQSLLPLFDPPPPHTVHALPEPPRPREPEPESPRAPPISGGEKAKARDILAAIRTLKAVEREQRHATPEERAILARFGGFGPVALSLFPDPLTGRYKPGWEEIGRELETLLNPQEYDSAKRTVFSQYFTAPAVMDAMHDTLKRLGVPDSGLVLEPGCGVANFMTGPHRYIGVELDSLSGRIARALHPTADIRIENFRDSKLPPLDAVIGNVPFANIALPYHGQKFSLHDFFVCKSIDSLKPGGVLAVVTSHYTLDKQNAAAREYMADRADFLGAIRLPSNAFKREGTEVVTDILFLRKRAPGQEPQHAADWLHAAPLAIEGADVPVNRYFLDHPEMVLGEWSRKDTLYGEGYSVTANGELADQLRNALGRIVGSGVKESLTIQSEAERPNPPPVGRNSDPPSNSTPAFIPPPPIRHVTEGSLFIGDDHIIRQVENGEGKPVVYSGVTLRSDGTPQARKIASLIRLRDLARRVLQSQNEGWPEENRQEARRELNWAYDRFTAGHGPINKTTFAATRDGGTIRRMPNLVKFREDPDAMLVMALEEYDEETGTARKAPILLRDVVGPKPPVDHVASAEDGLLVSLDRKGAVDLPFIATLYGKPEAAIIAELGDLIYRDPATKEWQTADEYLSGNVREKLKAAEAAGPEYRHNADALRQVQPEDVLPGDIDANLGAPWIPASDIKAFAEELFGGSVSIGHLKKDALWSVDADYRAQQSVAATTDYGTGRINGTALFEQALNMKTPVIYDLVHNGDREERVLNPVETAAAKEKQKAIKERFRGWVFSEPERAERLVRIYNDTYNNTRPRLFDGSHLEFPGMSTAFELKQHQKDAVWRCMSGGNTLLAHAVGAGKTAEIVVSAMKMKQCGLIAKPIVICPNHMLEQFAREWMQIYPNAKLLIAGKEDFTKERRKALTARIATGDWDGIIVTHSSFERIGMSKEYQERFLREQIREYDELLTDSKRADSGRGNRNLIKQIEKQKARREEKLKDLLAEGKKDDGLTFDLLGVDQIFVDECFTYDTLIETDRGPLKIGEIVTKKLQVNVKSVNSSTHAVEWKPVVNWFANKRRTKLIEVVHEEGSIRCTPSHKLFTGIVTYRKAGEIEAGESLLVLQGAFPSKLQDASTQMAEVLLDRVSHQGQDANGDMRVVQDAVLLPHTRSGQTGEAPSALLLRKLQDAGAASESGIRGEISNLHAVHLGQPADEREKISRDVRTDERMLQVGRVQREGISRSESHRPQTTDQGWQWTPDNSTSAARGKNGYGDGACNSHKTDPASHGESGEALQGGSCGPIPDAGGGAGWEQSQQPESPRTRCQEGQSLVPSRVVSVTVLQPGSDGEYRFGGRDHSIVYDIEVADNHNYFANGVLVSNCQAYKNLETPTKMERVAGIQTGGSERAFDLLMKVRYLDEKHPGHGLVGASGTPISNSMVEMYTLQRYFDPQGLKDRGIEHFDAWAGVYGEVMEAMEISPDGSTMKPRSRFSRFINLPELSEMYRSFADVQTAEMLNLPRPKLATGKPVVVACPMTEEQRQMQHELVRRYERIRSERVDPREDNALAITTDGRKLALHPQLLSSTSLTPARTKLDMMVDIVADTWRDTAARRSTQLIFCDMGVNPTPWGFSVYDCIIDGLTARGVPRVQIATIGEADTDAKKQALFEKVRQGQVRILIGSTQKMGTGTNVQKRLIALHNLDVPWRPCDVEQRDGRGLRQGNQNGAMWIYRYVTEGSFDSYMWQGLETKARFINQMTTGNVSARSAEDIGGQELSYAEVKAIASGNPAVLTLAETDAELQRLSILRKNHADEQFMARRKLRELPEAIDRLGRRIEGLAADQETAETHADDPLIIAGREIAPKDTLAALGKRLESLPEGVFETRRFALGVYRGLRLGLVLYPSGNAEVELEGEARRHATLFSSRGPRAVLNAAERLASSYGSQRAEAEESLQVARDQLRDYEARLGQAFAHREYMERLAELRDALKAGLSEHPPEGSEPVAEIAGKIEALRAQNKVEVAPRIGTRKATTAEEPVTARIRARRPKPEVAEKEAKPEPMAAEEKPEPITPPPKIEPIPLPEPAKPDYRQAVAHQRQAATKQMRLF